MLKKIVSLTSLQRGTFEFATVLYLGRYSLLKVFNLSCRFTHKYIVKRIKIVTIAIAVGLVKCYGVQRCRETERKLLVQQTVSSQFSVLISQYLLGS